MCGVGVWCIGATRGRVRHMGVCVAAETEAGRPSQAKDNAVCVSGLCVCVWTAVCVFGGGGECLWCVGRDTGIVSQPGKGQHCVCLRVCVYVCVRTRMCVWCGPGVCVLVGGGGREAVCGVSVTCPGGVAWVECAALASACGGGGRDRGRETQAGQGQHSVCV